jgi:hypothetical protein
MAINPTIETNITQIGSIYCCHATIPNSLRFSLAGIRFRSGKSDKRDQDREEEAQGRVKVGVASGEDAPPDFFEKTDIAEFTNGPNREDQGQHGTCAP